MKKSITNYQKYTFILLTCLCLLFSCGDDDPSGPTEQELAFERLAGDWTFGTNGSIVVDGQDVSPNYPGFSLSFADGTYQTQSGGDLFRASGTWEWLDEEAGSIRLDDSREITIVALTENLFNFTFFFSGSGGARHGISGNYDITVVK